MRPDAPGSAPASAASVCELLRCYAEDVLGAGPKAPDTRRSDRNYATNRPAGSGAKRFGVAAAGPSDTRISKAARARTTDTRKN